MGRWKSKRLWKWVALSVGGVVLALGILTAYLLRDPLPRFAERRSSLAEVRTSGAATENGYIYTPARVVAKSGLAVDLVVRRAVEDTGRTLPLAVILGGHLTGREAARMLGDTRGVLVAAVSYPFDGDVRPAATTFLREIPKIRGAFLDTPPALMLTLDYLLRLPGVDTTRVEGIGVSLGAPFAVVAGALDPRFTRVWAIHGSGGSYAPLEMNMRRTIHFAPVRIAAAAIADVIIAGPRLDPSRWVDRIAPRTFMMVNATADERMPHAQVEELFLSARAPKEQIQMSGGHVHGDSATITRLVHIVMSRVREATPVAMRAS
jgi:dienelactone hydrolase